MVTIGDQNAPIGDHFHKGIGKMGNLMISVIKWRAQEAWVLSNTADSVTTWRPPQVVFATQLTSFVTGLSAMSARWCLSPAPPTTECVLEGVFCIYYPFLLDR